MGFYDVFRAECAAQGLLAKQSPLRVLRDATVVRAQNVMDYYATEIPDTAVFNKQLGRLVPPWPVLWLEVAAPTSRRLRLPSRILDWPHFGYAQAGALVQVAEWPLNAPGVRWRILFTQFFAIPVVETPPGADWLRYPYVIGEVDLNSDGYSADDAIRYRDPLNLSVQMREIVGWNRAIFSDVLLLALSFCNCRNVALPETQPARRAPNRIEQRKHITPPTEHRFHTILIEPLKAKFAKPAPGTPGAPGQAATPGTPGATPPAPHALHIVRGHFHTYTAERPLFGNPELYGQFWIPQHVRGTTESGTVHADYEIKLPVSEAGALSGQE